MLIQAPHLRSLNSPNGRDHQAARGNARFGALGDTLAKIFQPITEQFVYGFTAQDVVALWIPRDATALMRSRDEYDVRTDKAMQGAHPLKQWIYSLYRNAKGLNYSNAWEETLREVETGPGLLIAQSILLGVASSTLIGKLSLMMGYSDLKSFSSAFKGMLNSTTMQTALQKYQGKPEELELMLNKGFINRLLHQGHFRSGLSRTVPVNAIRQNIQIDSVNDGNAALIRLLKSARKGKSVKGITFREALDAWSAQWTAIDPKAPKAIRLQQIDRLESSLKRLTYWFNDSVKKVSDPHLVNKLEIPALGHHPHTVEHVVENLRKFRPFIHDANTLALGEMKGIPAKNWGAVLRSNLVKATSKLFKAVVVRKTLLSLAASLLAGWVVVSVSAIAQRGKTYPANKKFMLTGNESNNASQQGQSAGPHFRGHQQQVRCQSNFSRQSSQPAHSVEPAAVSFAPGKGGLA